MKQEGREMGKGNRDHGRFVASDIEDDLTTFCISNEHFTIAMIPI